MLALSFSFPARRYHATPWGRHVNEADVAWPPEPWRILRALIATYWRKGACVHWSKEDAARLIDALAAAPPVFQLPDGAVHAHTRHYMPAATKPALVFDAFAHLPDGAAIVVAWPDLMLEPQQFALVADLADGIGYLGRAESWVKCTALTNWDVAQANCLPVDDSANGSGEMVGVFAPLSAPAYAALRAHLLEQADADERAAAQAAGKRAPTERVLRGKRDRTFGVTLPERLMDALAVDTAEFQKHGWNRPPAAREIGYRRAPLSPHPRRPASHRARTPDRSRYTVARYLLAGRPQPRIKDAVRIGELMRTAALSQFGWEQDPRTGHRRPLAPPEVSGRGEGNAPLRDAHHSHAFWLPEDADGDGLIDHVCVYAAMGFDDRVRAALDRLTRLWVRTGGSGATADTEAAGRREWRLALEGFGTCREFAPASALFRTARYVAERHRLPADRPSETNARRTPSAPDAGAGPTRGRRPGRGNRLPARGAPTAATPRRAGRTACRTATGRCPAPHRRPRCSTPPAAVPSLPLARTGDHHRLPRRAPPAPLRPRGRRSRRSRLRLPLRPRPVRRVRGDACDVL